MAEIFKAYDIRGVYGSELTDDIVYRTARVYAQLINNELSDRQLRIVVGCDMRVSSPALKHAVIAGLVEEGVRVIDINLVSTPAFYFAVAHFGYDGGIMVSASHNPPEYNGLKLVRAGAVPIGWDTGIQRIRNVVTSTTTFTNKKGGTVETRDDIVTADVQYALDFFGTATIKPFRIVADAANAMGATYLKELFKHLPCHLIEMNFKLDGTFPAHEADPFKEKNLQQLMECVVAEHADLGIATDGDGDRIFYIDSEGKLIDPAIVRGILAMLFLEDSPGATICYDIRPGRITRDLILEHGGNPSVTKVGHSLIKEQALREGAVFAGESSGHFFVKMDHGLFEAPCIVTLKFLKWLSRSEESTAKQVQPYRKYFHSGEINSEVVNSEAIMKKIQARYVPGAKEVSLLDGVTIEYENYWFNVRPSNTESLLRLNLEATSKAKCEEKTHELLSLIRS